MCNVVITLLVAGCGGTLIANESLQTLTSPGYPDGYANELQCTWTISTEIGQHIWVNVTDIDTESHVSCSYDAVSFYESEYLYHMHTILCW